MIEFFLFSFSSERFSRSEVCGLRYLVFSVDDIDAVVAYFESYNVKCEIIRVDLYT